MENSRLQEAPNRQNKGNKRDKALPLIQRQNWEAETQWWSPSRVDKADEAEIRKADAAELRETTHRLKQKLEVEEVEKRAREKKERDERKAAERKALDERKAEREHKRQAQGLNSCRASWKAFSWCWRCPASSYCS